ncbi:MAG TPA: S8 family serine peptidase [Solirubrobacteraceae bacterium]|nr:S8 family serine peptidase [Solirubrobacteraceae bacterium]
MKVRLAALTAAALLAAPAAASAAATPQPPMVLPGDATASSLRASESTWIVGARPTAQARVIAKRFGAKQVGPDGTGGYVIGRSKARAFADALGGLLVYAQPDTLAEPLASVPNDPLSATPYNWRAMVADPALTPPAVGPTSPLIALVDAQLDKTHPELANSNTNTIPQFPITISHGTATASVAAAPQNGIGIVGVWPNARALNLPLPAEITCSRSANQIEKAIENGAAVINMSYGSRGLCMPEYIAIQFAVARGIVPVAAAGNEFDQGNPPEFPASLPHVLTVAAVGPDGKSSYFSNANTAVDLSAPGEQVMTAVPPALDGDGTKDGYELQSGTSFSAPMVAAAVAWVKAVRPTLSGDQLTQAVRLSASDLGNPGWDPDTGFGLLSVAGALQIPTPPRDPGEPNDDIVWVDGRAFGKPDRLFYKGHGHKRLVGLLDTSEDPGDVYRIRLRPHSRVKVRAKPAGNDDVALYAFKKKAKAVRRNKALKKASHKNRGGTERFVLRNRGRRSKVFYLAIEVQPKARDLDAVYTLRVG